MYYGIVQQHYALIIQGVIKPLALTLHKHWDILVKLWSYYKLLVSKWKKLYFVFLITDRHNINLKVIKIIMINDNTLGTS